VALILGLTPQALRWGPLRGLTLWLCLLCGSIVICGFDQGLTPQALRWRPLRGL